MHSSLLTNICLLNRPHHPQRQLLCVGQALDAGDVEPLIWAIAAQRLHIFTAVQPPNLDGSIVPAASEETTIRTGSQRLYRSFVPLARQDALRGLTADCVLAVGEQIESLPQK